ncbi:hypothetical protein [Streptomyces varsoviensis]|uniref:Uncharacterized protein n=1 Tax=Streptomyces varsoviensis TaxID=67373 RepID=A0ABR5J988_9ACTN|nr:hypothetical protein [Streptomyces varsoviensis]KOG89666.1 hypothetical protein ADK38_12995 [Streptomyces varsoviensis]
MAVPDANPPNLAARLTRNGGPRPEGSRLTPPRVPLNKRNHFKLLVLLSGAGPRDRVTLEGFLSGDTAKNTMRAYVHVPCADLRARPGSPCVQP